MAESGRVIVGLIVALILFFATVPADAFRWPWQQVRHHYRHHRGGGYYKETAPPNCQQINDAVKDLDHDTLAHALNSLTRKQRQFIDQCSIENGGQ